MAILNIAKHLYMSALTNKRHISLSRYLLSLPRFFSDPFSFSPIEWGVTTFQIERQAPSRENPSLNRLAARFEALAICFTKRCNSSFVCMNEYLAICSGDYTYEWSSSSNCSMSECFLEKSRWSWNEQVCYG